MFKRYARFYSWLSIISLILAISLLFINLSGQLNANFSYPLIAFVLLPLILVTLYFLGSDWTKDDLAKHDYLEGLVGKNSFKHVPQLDGYRAFALLVVIASHFLDDRAWIELHWGRIGVVFFFVLSGFLITPILYINREKSEEANSSQFLVLRNFYARRFLRIYPAYYLTIFVLFLIGYEPVRTHLIWFLTYTVDIAQGWFGVPVGIESGHLWSLCVEEQFYLIYPLIILFAPKRFLKLILFTLILLSVSYKYLGWHGGMRWDGIVHTLLGSLDALSLGSLFALCLIKPEEFQAEGRFLLALSSGIGPALFAVLQVWFLFTAQARFNPVYIVLIDIAISLTAIAFIRLLIFRPDSLLARALSFNPITYIGKISYGGYLYHKFVPMALIDTLTGYPRFILITVASLALASLSWHVFEGPINQLKERFPYLKASENSHIAVPEAAQG